MDKPSLSVKLWAQIGKISDVEEQFELDLAIYFKFNLPTGAKGEGGWAKVSESGSSGGAIHPGR